MKKPSPKKTVRRKKPWTLEKLLKEANKTASSVGRVSAKKLLKLSNELARLERKSAKRAKASGEVQIKIWAPPKPRMPFYELLAPKTAGIRHLNRDNGDLVYYCCLYNRDMPDGRTLHYQGLGPDGYGTFVDCDDNSLNPPTFLTIPATSGKIMRAGMRFGCVRAHSDGVHYEIQDVVVEIGRSFPWLIIERQQVASTLWGLEGVN